MATETVLDRLGNPCAIAAAFDRFSPSIEDARALPSLDLKRFISSALVDIDERGYHSYNALQLALDSLPNSTDDDPVRALLTMAIAYQVDTDNRQHELAGRVLVALEHGKLLEASHG